MHMLYPFLKSDRGGVGGDYIHFSFVKENIFPINKIYTSPKFKHPSFFSKIQNRFDSKNAILNFYQI